MDFIILGDLQPRYQYGQQGWLYVILSRVRTLKGLFTLVKLDSNMSKYKPRLDVMQEMDRLEKIEVETLKQLNSRNVLYLFEVFVINFCTLITFYHFKIQVQLVPSRRMNKTNCLSFFLPLFFHLKFKSVMSYYVQSFSIVLFKKVFRMKQN